MPRPEQKPPSARNVWWMKLIGTYHLYESVIDLQMKNEEILQKLDEISKK